MTKAFNLQAPVDTLAMEFTREFDAPVQALFRAHADPDLVAVVGHGGRHDRGLRKARSAFEEFVTWADANDQCPAARGCRRALLKGCAV
jgi:uncharacterized protein YndB with AHSA1/START domain